MLVTTCHWVALPTLITWDGHEYLALADVLGSDRFPHDWRWLRAPLFPLSLKVVFALLGRNPIAAKGVAVSMAVMGCLLIASCVRRVAGPKAAAFSLALLAIYPTLIAFEHAILTETGTFFFVALALRLSLWTPETLREAWSKVSILGLVLGASYYWRQSLFALVPWFALLHLASARSQLKGRRGSAQVALQALVLLLVPWLLKTPWSLRFESEGRSAHVVQAFAVKQALFPIDDPRVAPVSREYRQAIENAEREGSWSGMTWSEASRLADKIAPASPSGVFAYLATLVAQYPTRYAAGVGRTLVFFAGFDGTDNSVQSLRALVLSPAGFGAKIGEGPEPIASRLKEEFFHPTSPGALQRALWALCGPFDRGVIASSFAAVALFLLSLRRRDLALFAMAGTPLAFALAHALLLFSTNRFMVPIYPITLACGVVSVTALVRWLTRSFEKETNTMTAPSRAVRARNAILALVSVAVLLFLAHSCGKSQVGEEDSRAPAPAATPATSEPGSSAPNLGQDAANFLPDLTCGMLDGARPTQDGSIFLWGWAYDPRNGSPASAVILLVNGERLAESIPVVVDRPDVAEALGNPRLRTSGWNFRLPASLPREHAFEAYAMLADGKLGRLGGSLSVSKSGEVKVSR